jgi:hypothetical protein
MGKSQSSGLLGSRCFYSFDEEPKAQAAEAANPSFEEQRHRYSTASVSLIEKAESLGTSLSLPVRSMTGLTFPV